MFEKGIDLFLEWIFLLQWCVIGEDRTIWVSGEEHRCSKQMKIDWKHVYNNMWNGVWGLLFCILSLVGLNNIFIQDDCPEVQRTILRAFANYMQLFMCDKEMDVVGFVRNSYVFYVIEPSVLKSFHYSEVFYTIDFWELPLRLGYRM